MFLHKRTQQETKEMLLSSSQQSKAYAKRKAAPEKLRETWKQLGMDFSNVEKYKACRNREDGNKVATISV